MFSVIIPLYNKAPYVDKAICSVLSQTYREFELIVIDDGSTDESLSIVQKYESQRVRVISQTNRGVAEVRNKGVGISKYDYIAFLDADDWWHLDYLQQMSELIREYPDAGLYSSRYFKVKNGRCIPALIGVDDGFEKGVINYFKVYSRTLWQPVWTGATIIPKKLFMEEDGFDPRLKLGEDFNLWVRMALKYDIVYLHKPLAFYNQDVDQRNRAIGKKMYESSQHFLYSDYSFIRNEDFTKLYDQLAVYGLLPYYLARKNEMETRRILRHIEWENQPLKYKLYYNTLPRWLVRIWLDILSGLYTIKRMLPK